MTGSCRGSWLPAPATICLLGLAQLPRSSKPFGAHSNIINETSRPPKLTPSSPGRQMAAYCQQWCWGGQFRAGEGQACINVVYRNGAALTSLQIVDSCWLLLCNKVQNLAYIVAIVQAFVIGPNQLIEIVEHGLFNNNCPIHRALARMN